MKTLTPESKLAQTDFLQLRVVIRKEFDGDGTKWLAQCLEHDVTAQGDSLDEVKSRFARTVMGYATLALKHNENLFANIQPAPEQYYRLWEKATELKDSLPMSFPSGRIPTRARQLPSRAPKGEALLRLVA
jgi:hypothetical protein